MSSDVIIKQSEYFEAQSLDVKKGELEAVVTSFKNYDAVNDVILEDALDSYLEKFQGGLPMLWQHEKNEIIGVWTKLRIDGDKVIGSGQIFPEVSRGSDAMALISRGMVGATSIGFRAREYEQNDQGGLTFKEIDLVEISLVRTPANPKAQIISAKEDDGTVNIRKLEKALRDAGLSRKESKALLSEGQTGLRDAVQEELDTQDLLNRLKLELGV